MLRNQTMPEEAKRALIRAKLKPGSIVHLYCDFIDNPNNKFMVIMYIDDDVVLACLINSRIHPLNEKDPRLRACQVRLEANNYPFLNYYSFLNCARVFDDINTTTLIDRLLSSPEDYKDRLCETDLLETIEAIKGADTISDIDRDCIINALGE